MMKPGGSIYLHTKSIRKYCLLLVLSSVIVMTAKSQLKFGLVGGINESTLLIGHENSYYVTGFEAGIASEVNLSRHFYLFPELVFITRGDEQLEGRQAYLNLPILAGYRIQKHIELLAGPTVGYLLSIYNEPYDIYNLKRKIDFGFSGAARFRINPRTGIDISYMQSFNGIYKSKNVVDGNVFVVSSKGNPVNQTFQISYFYLFL
jgi:hypothetical protein